MRCPSERASEYRVPITGAARKEQMDLNKHNSCQCVGGKRRYSTKESGGVRARAGVVHVVGEGRETERGGQGRR